MCGRLATEYVGKYLIGAKQQKCEHARQALIQMDESKSAAA